MDLYSRPLVDCKREGWLLDGFPRNKVQAEKLDEALKSSGMKLDYVAEILLDRETAKTASWDAVSA